MDNCKARRQRGAVRVGVWALLALAMTGAHAQELTNARVVRGEVGIGEPIELQLELRMIENSRQTVCNLAVDFGDGQSEQVRVTSAQLTLSLQHTYQRAGQSVIQVGGKTRFQGLNTALACFGGNKTVAINVLPENFSARRAAAIAEKEAALKRAEQDRKRANAAADEAQQRRVEAELAAKRAREKAAVVKRSVPPPAPPAPAPAAKAPPEAPKLKASQPKAKSSLDL